MADSRNEDLLENILGESNPYGEPQSPIEAILQNMLGEENVLRNPESRNEELLLEILEQGGGGGEYEEILKSLIDRSITSITIPDGVTKIGKYAFAGCDSLLELEIPNGVTEIGAYAVNRCANIQRIVVADSVTKIEENGFSYNYYLESIVLPSGLTRVENSLLAYSSRLKSLTIPSGVTYIAAYAMIGMARCEWIKFLPTTPPSVAASNSFSALNSTCKILVPQGTLSAYTSATNYPNPSTHTYEEYSDD